MCHLRRVGHAIGFGATPDGSLWASNTLGFNATVPWYREWDRPLVKGEQSPVLLAPWELVAGQVRDVAIGPKGTVFALGWNETSIGGYPVLRWHENQARWMDFGGQGVKLTVEGNDHPILVNALGDIWAHDGTAWNRMPARRAMSP